MFPVCFVDVPFVADIHNSASLLVVVFCRVSLSIVKTSFLDVVCLSQVFLFLHKYHDQKITWGGKCLFSLHFQTVVHHQRKSGLELKQVRRINPFLPNLLLGPDVRVSIPAQTS